MATDIKIDHNSKDKLVDPKHLLYLPLVDLISYLELAYAVGINHVPKCLIWLLWGISKVLLMLVFGIKGILDVSLIQLVAYSNSNYARCKLDKEITSRGC